MTTVYVDGCSYTAGYGLSSQYSLAKLIEAQGYTVTDQSAVGKSNYSMALDLYQASRHDFYVVGWTFSPRMEYVLDNQTIFASASMTEIGLGDHPLGDYLEQEYREFNSRFFKYISRFDMFSDFLVDSTSALLGPDRCCFFSWEKRNSQTAVLYPVFGSEHRQQDVKQWQQLGHLNEQGMTKLSEIVLTNLKTK